MPFAWFTADEVYGQAKYLQAWLEERDVFYVLAIRRSDTLTTADGAQRADALVAALPARAWQRLSVGAGAHGPREYDWARVPVQTPAGGPAAGTGCWPAAPSATRMTSPITPATGPAAPPWWIWPGSPGSRWRIEECFQQAKNEAGLDHYQVRTWRAWYAHITLSMLALAWLAASKAQAVKGEPAPATRA